LQPELKNEKIICKRAVYFVTDAGVGALCARSAVIGAFMNVRINAAGYNDKTFTADIMAKGTAIENKMIALETEILGLVNEKIGI